MKKINLMLGIVTAFFVVLAGCKKADQALPAPQVNGVTVDLPKLTEAFTASSQELRSLVTQVGFNIRYTKYEDALMALDKLVNDPGLTEDQKKIVNTVIEQTKKLASTAPGVPAPAQ
jgi:hypothetical protein